MGRVHGYHEWTAADLPADGRRVVVTARLRRLRCPVPVPDAGGHLARPAWRQRSDIGMGKEPGQPDPEHLTLLV